MRRRGLDVVHVPPRPARTGRGLALPCHEIFVWTMDFPRGMLVPCHSLRSAAHCATRTAVARIASILSQERFDSRSALGRRICEEFSFADARGRPQLAGCMKALGALAERVPDIVLPPPKASAVERRPRLLNTDVPEPEGVPAHPMRIRDLEIAAVADAADRALWNTLIAREHPHGMTTFAGCQVRYLVGSAHGWPRGGGICRRRAAGRGARALDRMGRRRAPGPSSARRVPEPFPDPPVGALPATWPATCSGASCAACRATSRNATVFARISLRASPTRDITEPACARPTSCASARPPVAVARTGRNGGRRP